MSEEISWRRDSPKVKNYSCSLTVPQSSTKTLRATTAWIRRLIDCSDGAMTCVINPGVPDLLLEPRFLDQFCSECLSYHWVTLVVTLTSHFTVTPMTCHYISIKTSSDLDTAELPTACERVDVTELSAAEIWRNQLYHWSSVSKLNHACTTGLTKTTVFDSMCVRMRRIELFCKQCTLLTSLSVVQFQIGQSTECLSLFWLWDLWVSSDGTFLKAKPFG